MGEGDEGSNPPPIKGFNQQFLKFSEHFLKLRWLKNYLNCTTSQNRRNRLAVLNIYRNVEINVNNLIKQFFSVSQRNNLLKETRVFLGVAVMERYSLPS